MEFFLKREFKDQTDKKTLNTYQKIWGIGKRVENYYSIKHLYVLHVQ